MDGSADGRTTRAAASQPPQRSERVLAGILLRLMGVGCFAGLAALAKWVGGRGVPIFEIVLFRNAFAFLPLAVYVLATSGPQALRTRRPLAHLIRAGFGIAAMTCSFTAVQHLPLAENTSVAFTAPLFMTALSALVLREKVGPHRWAALFVGFLGMLVMVRPDAGAMAAPGAAFALGAALLFACSMITVRQIGATESGAAIVFYYSLAGAAAGAVGSLFGWVTPDPNTLAGLIACGLLGGAGQLLHTQALRMARVGVVAPFDYSELLWALSLGLVIWGDLPRPATLAGALIVAGSGLYILHREVRRRGESGSGG